MLPGRIAALVRCGVGAGLCAFAAVLAGVPAAGQSPRAVVPRSVLASVKTVTPAEYRAHLDSLRGLVADCGRVVTGCDAAKVGDDDRVQPASGAPYIERYGWLRDLLDDRNDTDHAQRREMLPRAEQRLAEQEAELDGPQVRSEAITAAQKAAREAVLRRSEFRTDRGYSVWDRIAAWITEQLNKLFGGASALGRAAPWLGTVLQWGALLAAGVILLLWIYRALDRQRVALRLLSGTVSREEALAASRVWADQARQHAERGEWRDAVHALYWASIVVLEDRRTLRRSGTRTPREALKLVDAASPLGTLLRAQTGEFERIWYGLQPAEASDYERARVQHEAMREARAQAVAA
jgi:hypothetical protein